MYPKQERSVNPRTIERFWRNPWIVLQLALNKFAPHNIKCRLLGCILSPTSLNNNILIMNFDNSPTAEQIFRICFTVSKKFRHAPDPKQVHITTMRRYNHLRLWWFHRHATQNSNVSVLNNCYLQRVHYWKEGICKKFKIKLITKSYPFSFCWHFWPVLKGFVAVI